MGRKRTVASVPPSRTPRSQWRVRREAALAAKGYTKADVAREVARLKYGWAVQTVRAVIDGRSRNPEIQAVFCRLAEMSNDEAFPLAEPVYQTGSRTQPTRRNARRRDARPISTSEDAASSETTTGAQPED